jgi:WD40 repeat protein
VEGWPNCVEICRDKKVVACCCSAPFAYLWDAVTGKPLHTFRHGEEVGCCGFSCDGKWVITTGYRGGKLFASQNLIDPNWSTEAIVLPSLEKATVAFCRS